MKYILGICRYNIIRWKSSIRIIILFALLLIMQVMFTLPYIRVVNEFSYPIQIFETYIVSYVNKYSSLLISIIMIFIISDVPVRNKGLDNLLVKGTKSKWLASQWLYVLLCASVFCLITLLFNMLMVAGNAYLANEWSVTAMRLSWGSEINNLNNVFAIIPQRIMSLESPFEAVAWTFILQWLLFVLFGTLTVMINFSFNSVSAPAILILMNGINWLMRMFMPEDNNYALMSWFSPLFHGTYTEHQFRSIYGNGMAKPWQSAVILAELILILIFISHRLIKKSDMLQSPGGDYDE